MSQFTLTNNPLLDVTFLSQAHEDTWKDKTDFEWLSGLMEEVGELAESLNDGDNILNIHHELTQIASIAINFRLKLLRDES